MITTPLARRVAALALASMLCVACGSDSDDSAASDDAPTTEQVNDNPLGEGTVAPDTETDDADAGDSGDADSNDSGDALTPPEDLCLVVTADDIAPITGEAGVSARTDPFGCTYSGEDVRNSVYPTVSVQENFDGAGGLEGAKAGAQAASGGTATDIEVDGNAGFVVVGSALGSPNTAAVVEYRGLLVSTNLSGDNAAMAEQILATVISKLG